MVRKRIAYRISIVLTVLLLVNINDAHRTNRRSSKRKTLIREIPVLKEQLSARCNNTVQGRWLITDSEGFVCARENLSSETQCCSGGTQYACETCDPENQCCEDYEMCVSCCMAPQYQAAELMLKEFRAAGREETGHWETPFEFCKGKCRTTSRSTVHENAYLSPRHHCFSASGKPTVPSPPVPDIPSNLRVLVTKERQSCKERCGEDSLDCLESHFPALNDCNRLRDSFACEAGCEAGTGPGLPAYIIPKAAKSERPAMCLTWSPEMSKDLMTCDSLDGNRQRACPCGA